MTLTRGDDYPIHQTSEPIAYSGTDRNFYDRYFFNGYGGASTYFGSYSSEAISQILPTVAWGNISSASDWPVIRSPQTWQCGTPIRAHSRRR